mgnify:FL=1
MLDRETFEEVSRFLNQPSNMDDLVRVLSRGCLESWEAGLTMRGYDPDCLREYELRYFPGRSGKTSFEEFRAEAAYVEQFLNGTSRTPEEWLSLCSRFRFEPPWLYSLSQSQTHLRQLPKEVARGAASFNVTGGASEEIEDPGNRKSGASKSHENRIHAHVKRQIIRLCVARAYTEFSAENKLEFIASVMSDHLDEENGFLGNRIYNVHLHGDPTPLRNEKKLRQYAEEVFEEHRAKSNAGS